MQMILPIIIFTAILVLALVLVFYYKLLQKYIDLVKHEERLSKSKRVLRRTRKKANKILDEARQNAQEIIQQSNLKSQQIINQTQMFSDEQRKNLFEQLKTYENQQLQSYKDFLESLRSESINLLNNISQQVNSNTMQDIAKLNTSMQKYADDFDQKMKQAVGDGINKLTSAVSQSQQQALTMIEQQRKKVDMDIQAYQQAKIQKVQERIFEVIKTVTKDFLGKSLNPKEHEEVVYKSLERAKKENLFE